MRLGAGDRGQAIQIGAVILFGFVVVAFAGYQAVSVPDQNQKVEFQHSLQVTDEMQEFRTDVIEAASTGSTRSQAFKLGTEYPTRAFAVNPPPASGQLAATTFGGGEYVLDAPGASLEDICGLSRNDGTAEDVPSQALVYEPNYNVYTQAPDVVYENTVTYRQFPGQVRLDSGQNLVDGKTLTLTPLVGDVDESTSATRTVDLEPGKAGIGATNSVDGGTYTLTVPTALDAGTWEELLESELEANGGQVEGVTDNANGGVDIELLPAEYTVICPVVGFDTTPNNTPNDELQRSGDGSSNLNPGDTGEVRLDTISTAGPKDTVRLTFTNEGDTVNLSFARYNFYFGGTSGGGANPESLDVEDTDGTTIIQDLQLRGETKTPQENLTFDGSGANTDVDVVLSENYKSGDYFVVTLGFTDGQESLYFVDIADSDGGNSAPTASFDSSNGGPDTIDVDASGSSDPDGDTLTYDWDWTSDGSYDDLDTGVTTSHTYESSGTYDVTLRVSDGNGGADTVTQSVTVGSESPDPSVTVESVTYDSSTEDLTVTYTPDDPEANLDTADITVVDRNGKEQASRTGIDISGEEGNTLTETFTGLNSAKAPYTVTVTVTDADGDPASDTGSS